MSILSVTIEGVTHRVEIGHFRGEEGSLSVRVDGEPVEVSQPVLDGHQDGINELIIAGRFRELQFDRDLRWIQDHNRFYRVEVRDLEAGERAFVRGDGQVMAPIPGQVRRVLVATGQVVEAGQSLLILEAMKMENEICAPRAGKVQAVHVQPGKSVARKELLMEIL